MTLPKKAIALVSADQFEKFRNKSISSFQLDSAHYFFTSGYSLDTMPTFTRLNINLTSDIEKYQFIESMLRLSISMICEMNDKASNKSLKSYKPSQTTIFIIYLDSDNLYQHSMMQLLPI